jgi:hypothetical protein
LVLVAVLWFLRSIIMGITERAKLGSDSLWPDHVDTPK